MVTFDLLIKRFTIKRVLRTLHEERQLLFIDVAIFIALVLMIITDQYLLFSHFIFVLLIYGAFYWTVFSFIYRAGFWVSATIISVAIPIYNGQSNLEELLELPILIFILFMVFNITSRRTLAERALKTSERHYQRLVELTFESVIIIVDDRLADINPQAVKLLNASCREDLIGKSLDNFLTPISFKGFKLLQKQAIEGSGEMPLIEDQLIRNDKTYVDIEAVGLVITHQERPALQLIMRDISERKLAEKDLRISEMKFRGLLESAPDVVVVTDEYGIILLVNARTEEVFGYSREELVGHDIDKLLPEQHLGFFALHRPNSYVELRPPNMGKDIEAQRKNGGVFPVNLRVSPVITEEGLLIITIFRDITERKQAEKHIERAARLATLGQMTTALAHELNNPLQIIQSYLDLILDYDLEPDEKESYLQIARQQIERLRDNSKLVLNYARPDQKSKQPVRLVDLVEQVLSLARKQLQQRSIQVKKIYQEVPNILAAANPLIQVFLNLVINAIESSEDGNLLIIELKSVDDLVP